MTGFQVVIPALPHRKMAMLTCSSLRLGWCCCCPPHLHRSACHGHRRSCSVERGHACPVCRFWRGPFFHRALDTARSVIVVCLGLSWCERCRECGCACRGSPGVLGFGTETGFNSYSEASMRLCGGIRRNVSMTCGTTSRVVLFVPCSDSTIGP